LRLTQQTTAVQASLYFNGGNLIHATYNDLSGVAATDKILSIKKGYFKFVPNQLPKRVTINKAVQYFLLESQRRSDELKNISEKLPPESTILFIRPNLERVPQLNTREWKVLSLINGRRDIKRICERLGNELATKIILYGLLKNGLINTVSEFSGWEQIIPLPISSEKIKTDRPYPPLLRTNLLLKAIDGQTTLGRLKSQLRMTDTDLVDDLKLLFDTQWIKFQQKDKKTFDQIRYEM
jgi:hypothetical protein